MKSSSDEEFPPCLVPTIRGYSELKFTPMWNVDASAITNQVHIEGIMYRANGYMLALTSLPESHHNSKDTLTTIPWIQLYGLRLEQINCGWTTPRSESEVFLDWRITYNSSLRNLFQCDDTFVSSILSDYLLPYLRDIMTPTYFYSSVIDILHLHCFRRNYVRSVEIILLYLCDKSLWHLFRTNTCHRVLVDSVTRHKFSKSLPKQIVRCDNLRYMEDRESYTEFSLDRICHKLEKHAYTPMTKSVGQVLHNYLDNADGFAITILDREFGPTLGKDIHRYYPVVFRNTMMTILLLRQRVRKQQKPFLAVELLTADVCYLLQLQLVHAIKDTHSPTICQTKESKKVSAYANKFETQYSWVTFM